MPIKPENRKLYPPDWDKIRVEILNRAGHACEGSPEYPDCRAGDRQPHPVTGSKVILTIAHMDQDPTNNGEPGNRPNLRALCQRCHLTHDAKWRAQERQKQKENKGRQETLFDEFEKGLDFGEK